MISVERLKVEFGVKPLFSDASFVINERDRIALVGKNGAGKSTLLKILCGMQKPTDGTVSVPQDTTIGYLPQVMKLVDDTTVREEASKAFAGNTELKARVDRLNAELAERTDYDSQEYMALVDRFTREHDRYMMMGAEGYEADIERTLIGLGFTRNDFDRPTSEFSGGWRMRCSGIRLPLYVPVDAPPHPSCTGCRRGIPAGEYPQNDREQQDKRGEKLPDVLRHLLQESLHLTQAVHQDSHFRSRGCDI